MNKSDLVISQHPLFFLLLFLLNTLIMMGLIFILRLLNILHPLRFFITFLWSIAVWLIGAPLGLYYLDQRSSFRDTFTEYIHDIRLSKIQPIAYNLFLGISCSVMIIICLFGVLFFSGVNEFNLNLIFPPASWNLLTSFGPGIFEELIFRGILLTYLLIKFDKPKAIILSSIGFSSVHSLNILFGQSLLDTVFQLGYTFFIGLFLGYLFLKTGSLLPNIVVHYLLNALSPAFLFPLYESGVEPALGAILIFFGIGVIPCFLNIFLIKFVSERLIFDSTDEGRNENSQM